MLFLLSFPGPLWEYDNILPSVTSLASEGVLGCWAQSVCELLSPVYNSVYCPGAGGSGDGETFVERWSRDALHWATSSSNRHSASRSFQVLRSLGVPLSETSVTLMLMRLADVVESAGIEAQGYALDVLLTLQHLVQSLRSSSGGSGGGSGGPHAPHAGAGDMAASPPAVLLPRIFWTCVCLFESTLVHEFEMALC